MSVTPGWTELLAGGFAALLGPALALPLAMVLLAGLVFARVRERPAHLATALALVLIFAAATTSRGLDAGSATGWVVSLAILLVLSWLVARHEGPGFPWLGLTSGLLLAALAIVWRTDAYGPLLGSLVGGWQSAPDRSHLFAYHLATAIGLGGSYLVGAELGRALPRRLGIAAWWVFSVGAGALSWSGAWDDLVHVLLLRWPYLGVG